MSTTSGRVDNDCFCDLLDLIFLSSGGVVAMLRAYLDASEQGGKILTVAGVAYGPDRAKKAHRKWVQLWGDTICHMADLHQRSGDFVGWGDKAGDWLKKSVRIIDGHASYCVAVSCDVAEYERLAPKVSSKENRVYLDGFRHPYPFCAHMAMTALGEITGDSEGIHYLFEAGDRYQGQAMNFMRHAQISEELRAHYRITSYTTMLKKDARLLEGADILAWEWGKHILRKPIDPIVRKSLAALLQVTPAEIRGSQVIATESRNAMHYGGDILAHHMQGFRELLVSGPLQIAA